MRHPVDYAPSQDFGDNPTADLPASHWIIKQFGNYQPDGHTGTDYPCPIGTPVRAVANGTVLHAGYYGGTYADNPFWISPGFAGYCYVVDHGAFIGIYGHCRDGGALVHVGQRVTEGQVLGPSGNTGASTGPHLHFEALPDGYVLNSYMYGRINPATLFGGSLSHAGTTVTPIIEQPKEWDEMATRAEIRAEIDAALVTMLDPAKDRRAGDGLSWSIWFERMLPGFNGNVSAAARLVGIDQAANDIRALLAAQNATVVELIRELASVRGGEPFDEEAFLARVEARAETGVKNAIESITVTLKES